MQKYIVTGCAGFIGSNLVEFLLEKESDCKIIGIDNLSSGKLSNMNSFIKNERFTFYHCDISDTSILNLDFSHVNKVFHFAALADVLPSLKNRTTYFNSLVVGTHNILELMLKNNIQNIVYAASSSCYGDPQCNCLISETWSYYDQSKDKMIIHEIGHDVNKYLAPYALYKNQAEREIQYYCKEFKLNAISLRFANVYGKRVKTSGAYGIVIGIFLAQHFQNHPLSKIGDGLQSRDFIDVRDVCNISYIVSNYFDYPETKEGYFNCYNLGTSVGTTINQLIEIINQNTNVINIPVRSNEAKHVILKNEKLLHLLHFLEHDYKFISIEEGIKYLMEYEQEYFKTIDFPHYI